MSTSTPAKPQSSSSTGYEVARPHGICSLSGKPIEAGEKFMAALRESPTGFERLDVSMDAWPTLDRANLLAFWMAVMPRHDQKKKVFVDDEVLCSLFERLSDTTTPEKLSFRFVLGLILMRKRLLVYENSRTGEEGKEIWTMRFKGKEDRLDLLNPKLDEQQVTDVSRQLGEILNEDL